LTLLNGKRILQKDNPLFKKIKQHSNPLLRGIGDWAEAILWAGAVAFLLFRPFIVESYKIMSGSMLPELQIGETLLVNKFIYGARTPGAIGLPLTHRFDIVQLPTFKLPAFQRPKLQDIVVFVSPNHDKKDYVKRLIGLPGWTVTFKNRQAFVKSPDAERFRPLSEPYLNEPGAHDEGTHMINNLDPVYVPRQGDTVQLNQCSVRDFFYARKAITQENDFREVNVRFQVSFDGTPRDDYTVDFRLNRERVSLLSLFARYLKPVIEESLIKDGAIRPNRDPFLGSDYTFRLMDNRIVLQRYRNFSGSADQYILETLPLNKIDGNAFEWQSFRAFARYLQILEQDREIEFTPYLTIEGKRVKRYTFKHDCYLMVGDNRDNSSDSRVWGFVSNRYIKGKAWFRFYSPKFIPFPNGKRHRRFGDWWYDVDFSNIHRIGLIHD